MRIRTIEEYVENIKLLEEKEGQACTNTLAILMKVKPPSITQVLQKLKAEGYVHYTPHAGATLTEKGKELANELDNKHRIIADFLCTIGLPSDVAEDDACRIEHHISKETIRRLEILLKSVRNDPLIAAWFEEIRK